MNQQEIINTIALTRIGYFGMAGLVELYQRVGSATEIVANRQDIRAIVPDASDRLVSAFAEMDVFIFYGLVPVVFSYYVIAGRMDALAFLGGITIGFMGVNVLLVNNYRDMEDDIEAGKRTAVVIFGRKLASTAYLFNGYMAIAMLSPLWLMVYLNDNPSKWIYIVPLLYLVMHTVTWVKLIRRTGASLNPLLGATARNMLIFAILMLVALCWF